VKLREGAPCKGIPSFFIEKMVNFTAERLFEKSKFCRELDLLANLPLILAKTSFYWRKFDFIGENQFLLANWKFHVIFSSSQNKNRAPARFLFCFVNVIRSVSSFLDQPNHA
jgi:hypothetical protein